MNDKLFILVLIFSFLIIFFWSCLVGYDIFNKKKCNNMQQIYDKHFKIIVKKSMEYAYFEGQKDCLNGDIRIKDGKYIKSPWDGESIDNISWKHGEICVYRIMFKK